MSEQTPETSAPVETEPTATVTPDETPADLGDAGKAAIARMKAERDAALRAAKENAEKVTAFEESQKTEQQKLADRAAAVERERDEAKADGLRYKAAAKHGIGEDFFDLLGSGDEETISSRAERVGGLIKENADMKAELEALRAGKPAPVSGRPTEALKPGATPENNKTEDDVLYDSLYGASR